MANSILIRPNNIPTRVDQVLGFDKYEEGRFPGTKTAMPPFKFQNGTYRHGVAKENPDRQVIQDYLLNGEDLDSPVGREYLSQFLIELGSDIEFIDKENPEQLLRYYCLLASKDIVAPSRSDAKEKTMSQRLYIIEDIGEDKKEKLTIKQKVNKAKAKLYELDTTPEYMIALAKYIAPSNAGIQDEEQAYLFLDELLSGKYTEDSEQMGVNRFNSALNVDKEVIFISSFVKEAMYKNVIRKQGGIYLNPLTNTVYGRTEDEVVSFLARDENQQELGTGSGMDETYSIRYQLKSKQKYKQ